VFGNGGARQTGEGEATYLNTVEIRGSNHFSFYVYAGPGAEWDLQRLAATI
jgi:hypothetical protein